MKVKININQKKQTSSIEVEIDNELDDRDVIIKCIESFLKQEFEKNEAQD